MAPKSPRRGKFTKLVANHVLGNVNWNELVTVVHGQGMSHKFGRDRRPSCPGLYPPLVSGLVHLVDFLLQLGLYIRALL